MALSAPSGGGARRPGQFQQRRNNDPFAHIKRNARIKVPEIRVISPEGKQLGIMATERALALAQALDATALPFDHFAHHLAAYDIIVGSTSAPDAVVRLADVAAALAKRRASPFLCLDRALPRDIEPAVADLENVDLYNLDDLAKIAAKNLSARESEVTRAREIIAEKAEAVWQPVLARHT